jgi:dTDP-4-amino-4,6-dideoxygalactose transaminase
MNVPLLDLHKHHASIRKEIDDAIRNVIDIGAFCGGVFTETFESEFAEYCGATYAVGVSSGTDALRLTLMALGVGHGDSVITVPNSFIATAEAISLTGATPVFVDVDPNTYNMNVAALEAAITRETMAIIPVHLYGHPADMDAIMTVADRHGIPVIEDACQAHGALYKGKRAGTIGTAGCFSFYPSKNLGAMGEAGAILTSDRQLSQQLQALRDHGQFEKHIHECVGSNSRLDGIQAAVLSVKLRHLPSYIDGRRRAANTYNAAFAEGVDGIQPPFEADDVRHVYHLYALRILSDRESLMSSLLADGIGCAVHYPTPIHLQNAYRHLGLSHGSYPVVERLAHQLLSLPMFPEMSQTQINAVINAVQKHACVSERECVLV